MKEFPFPGLSAGSPGEIPGADGNEQEKHRFAQDPFWLLPKLILAEATARVSRISPSGTLGDL